MKYSPGEIYFVPVAILVDGSRKAVHNRPHEDRENGQNIGHHHIDGRFELAGSGGRIPVTMVREVVLEERECINSHEPYNTPVTAIVNSTITNRCIVNGRCPHKGIRSYKC